MTLLLVLAAVMLPESQAGSLAVRVEKRATPQIQGWPSWEQYHREIFKDLKDKNLHGLFYKQSVQNNFVNSNVRPLCTSNNFYSSNQESDLTDKNCLIAEISGRLRNMQYYIRDHFSDYSSVDWNSEDVIQLRSYMLIWMSITPLDIKTGSSDIEIEISDEDRVEIVSLLQGKIYGLVLNNDIAGIEEELSNTQLPSLSQMRRYINTGSQSCAGKTFSWNDDLACSWEAFLSELYLLINTHKSKDDKVKRLSLSYDYKEKLEMQQLKNMFDGAVSEVQGSLEVFSNELTSVMLTNFDSIGNYFATLAEFDGDIAAADIGYIQSELEKYDNKLYSLNWALQYNAEEISELALISASLDAAFAWAKTVADMAIGIFSAIGGSFGEISAAFDSMNDATQKTLNAVRAGNLADLISDVSKDAQTIFNGFDANEDFLTLTAQLVRQEGGDQVIAMEELEGIRQEFLERYNAYSPQVGSDDIARMGAKWETIIDLIDEIFAEVTHAGASGAKGVVYAGNYIEQMKFVVPQISALLESRFDFQFDLMDSLAANLRAQLARSSVEELRGSIEHIRDNMEDPKIAKTQAALSTLVVSRIHTMQALHLHCNILEYVNAGEVPSDCENAMRTLSEGDITNAIIYRPETCVTNTNDGTYVSIPVTKRGRQDAINLRDLYSGNSTTFRIPDAQWLVDYGWLTPNDVREKVFYVKGFELFLVSDKDTHRSVHIGVDITPSASAVLIKDGNSRRLYEIVTRQEYEFRYKENEMPCDKTENNPHQWCEDLGDVCVVRDGILDNEVGVYPSIFSEWTLQVHDPDWSRIPELPEFVEVEETLYLQAKVFLCSKTPTQRPNVQVQTPSQDTDTGARCGTDNYYNRKQRAWKPCPFGSREALGGYYCEARPCWRQLQDTGSYPSGAQITQQSVQNEEQCLDLCEERSDCKAAVLSPSGHCHLLNTDQIEGRSGWKAAVKYQCPEWSETRRHMVHDELVPMDFTTNTLQIRTDNHSEKPWLKWIFVQFFESPDVSFGGFRIDLASNPPSWEIMNCNSAQRFSESLPASSSRIWTVGWDADNYRFTVFADGVKVVEHTLSDQGCRYSSWRDYSKTVKYVAFFIMDFESDYYRPGDLTNRT
ncbi:hypothetical protein ACHWQZ_G004344 [Mnemiopsis leidyi]